MISRSLSILTFLTISAMFQIAEGASITYGTNIEIGGTLKLTDSPLCFADNTCMTTAVFSDGSAIWGQISGYIDDQLDLSVKFATKEDKINKNAPNGYAGLDSSGRVTSSILPALSRSFVSNYVFTPETDDIWNQNTSWQAFSYPYMPYINPFSNGSAYITYSDNLGIYADNVNGTFCTLGLFKNQDATPVCSQSYTGIYGYITFNHQIFTCNIESLPVGEYTFVIKHISDNCKYGFSPVPAVASSRQLTVKFSRNN